MKDDRRLTLYKKSFGRKFTQEIEQRITSDKDGSYAVEYCEMLVQGAVGRVPEFGAALATGLESGYDFSAWLEKLKKKKPTPFEEQGYYYEDDELGIHMDIVAMEAARRYQFFILDGLKNDTAIVSFAEAGAWQSLTYCLKNKISFIGNAIDGLLLGDQVKKEPLEVNYTSRAVGKLKVRVGSDREYKASSAYQRAGLIDAKGNLYTISKTSLLGKTKDPKYGYMQLPQVVVKHLKGKKGFAIKDQDKLQLSGQLQETLSNYFPPWITINRDCLKEFYQQNKGKVKKASLVDFMKEKLGYPDREFIKLVFYSLEKPEDLDLTEYNFSGFDLSCGVFNFCHFGYSLNGTKFNNGYLRGADFTKVKEVCGAEFKGAHIEFIKANGIRFSDSDFLYAHCYYGQFEEAEFDIENRNLAIGLDKANLKGIKAASIDGEEIQRFLKDFYQRDNKVKGVFGPEFTMGGRGNLVDFRLVLNSKEKLDKERVPYKFMTCHDEEVLERRNEYSKYHESKAISLEKIFKSEDNAEMPTLVYISGQAGVGKTTATRIIANQWSEGLWPEIKYLFVLNCRSLTLEHVHEKYKQIDLASWIYHYQYKIHDGEVDPHGVSFKSKGYEYKDFKKFIKRIMERESDKIMFILDGMDELASQHFGQNIIERFQRREFGDCKVIMTSRYKAELEADERRRDIELIGFSQEGIEQYVESLFGEKKEKELLMRALKYNRVLERMAHIPALLNMLSGVFQRQRFDPLKLSNISVIYKKIESELLIRAVEGNKWSFGGSSVESKVEMASGFYGDHFEVLAKLAFLGFDQRLATLPMVMLMNLVDEAVKKGMVENNPKSKEAFKDTILGFGFIRCHTGNDYEFVHLSFQEYLAAWHAANNSEQEDVRYFIERTLFHPSYQGFYQFYLYMIKDNKKQLEWLLSQFNKDWDLVGENFVHYLVWCLEAAMPENANGKKLAPLEGVNEDTQQACFVRLQEYYNYYFDEMVKFLNKPFSFLDSKTSNAVIGLFSSSKIFEYLYTMDGNKLHEALTPLAEVEANVEKVYRDKKNKGKVPQEKQSEDYLLKSRIYNMIRERSRGEVVCCNSVLKQLLVDLESESVFLKLSAVKIILSFDVRYAFEELFKKTLSTSILLPTKVIKEDESNPIHFEADGRKLLYSAPFIQYLGKVLTKKSPVWTKAVMRLVGAFMEYIPNEMADNIELMLTDQDPAIRKLSVALLGLRRATNLGDIVQERIVDVFIEYNYLGDKELREEVFSILIRCNKINKVKKEKLLSEVIKQQDEDSNTDPLLLIIVIQCASSLGEQDVLDSALARTAELIKDIKSPEHPIVEFIFANSDIFINVKGGIIDLIVRFLNRGGENDFRFVLERLESIDECYLTEDVQELLTRIAKNKEVREVSYAFRGKALSVLAKVKEGTIDEFIRGVEKDGSHVETMLGIVRYIDKCDITEYMVACLFHCLSSSNMKLRYQLWRTIEALLRNDLRETKRGNIPRSYYSNPELMSGILDNLKKRKDGVVTPWLTDIKKYVEYCEVELTTEMMQEVIGIVASAKEGDACRKEAISIIGKVGEKGLFPKELESEICTTLNKALDDKDDIIGWLSFAALGDYGKGWLELYFEKIKQLLNRAILSEGWLFFFDIPSHIAKKIAHVILTLDQEEFTSEFVKLITDKLAHRKFEETLTPNRGVVIIEKLGDKAVTPALLDYLISALERGQQASLSISENIYNICMQVGRYLTRSEDRFLSIFDLKNIVLKAVQLVSAVTLWCNGKHSIMIYKDRERRDASILHVVSYNGGDYDEMYRMPFGYISELRKILEEGVRLMHEAGYMKPVKLWHSFLGGYKDNSGDRSLAHKSEFLGKEKKATPTVKGKKKARVYKVAASGGIRRTIDI